MTIPFSQAKFYTKGRQGLRPNLIIWHTMETHQVPGKAKQIALWFAGKTSPEASAHYDVDNREIWQNVRELDTAWAVNDFGFNLRSINIELAGSAAQTIANWSDAYALEESHIAAKLAADIGLRWHIPAVKLSVAEILAGKAGHVGHADITLARHIYGGHTDPGRYFPWSNLMNQIKNHTRAIQSK